MDILRDPQLVINFALISHYYFYTPLCDPRLIIKTAQKPYPSPSQWLIQLYLYTLYMGLCSWIPDVIGGGGETGVSETSASCTFYSCFLPPSAGAPTSFCFSFSILKCYANYIAKVFSFSPGSFHFGNPASRPLSSHFP